jgi:FkbM family methyltransferase
MYYLLLPSLEARATLAEPDPAAFECLASNVKNNGLTDVQLNRCAVGAVDGQIDFPLLNVPLGQWHLFRHIGRLSSQSLHRSESMSFDEDSTSMVVNSSEPRNVRQSKRDIPEGAAMTQYVGLDVSLKETKLRCLMKQATEFGVVDARP